MEWETAAPRADGVDHTVGRGGSAPGRSQRGPGRSQRGRTRSQQGRRMSRAASTFALVVSGSVLLGWQLELPILRTILPGRAAMSPLTAVTFVLVATALWLETESSGGHRPIRWLARAAAWSRPRRRRDGRRSGRRSGPPTVAGRHSGPGLPRLAEARR